MFRESFCCGQKFCIDHYLFCSANFDVPLLLYMRKIDIKKVLLIWPRNTVLGLGV